MAGLPSRPFRTVDLAAIASFCDLVLYSVTFNNDLEHDLATLEAYRAFRLEAAELGIRHFLEVFNPNAAVRLEPAQIAPFVNDSIVRTLAGVTDSRRPLFLKVAYNGADAMAELVEHDRSLVVGILGGAAGTTPDTFELLQRVHSLGARRPLRTQDQAGRVTARAGEAHASRASWRAQPRGCRPRLSRDPHRSRCHPHAGTRGRSGDHRSGPRLGVAGEPRRAVGRDGYRCLPRVQPLSPRVVSANAADASSSGVARESFQRLRKP
jgi:hypothetical protein